MLAGHFGLALVLWKRFPDISPYILCIGVGFLDIIFGLIAWTGLEGLDTTDGTDVVFRCDSTHSLIGSLLLSVLYGYGTGSLIPGFVASWSHFVLDWFVHRSDLYLDPFTKLVVGGLGLWETAPTVAYVLEAFVIIGAGIYVSRDPWTLGTSIAVLIFHFSTPYVNGLLFEYLLSLDEAMRGYMTTPLFSALFILPALLMGYTLTRAKRRTFQTIA